MHLNGELPACAVSELPGSPISYAEERASKHTPVWTEEMNDEFGALEQGGGFWDGIAAKRFKRDHCEVVVRVEGR